MANDENMPSVFGGKVNVMDVKSLAARASEAAQNNPRGGAPGGSEYMNFSGKRGIYTVGKDSVRVSDDELWIVDVTSFEEGWICWKGGKPVSTRLANIYTGVPVAAPHGDEMGPFDSNKGEGWFQAKALVMKSLEENGVQAYLKLNSVSGVSALAELIGEFSERASAGEPCWPIIRLDVEEFESQGFKNFKPKFIFEAWLDSDQMKALAEGVPIDEILDLPEIAPEPAPPARAIGRRRV